MKPRDQIAIGRHWKTVPQEELLPVLLAEIDALAAERVATPS